MYLVKRGGGEFQASLEGTNLPGDAFRLFTDDPKPRLRWTPELHDRFVHAVTRLGGPGRERSSLVYYCSKYRLGRQSNKVLDETNSSSTMVQRHLGIRIEAHSKYLRSMLETTCNVLIDSNLPSSQFSAGKDDECLSFPCDALKLPSLSEIATESFQLKPLNGASMKLLSARLIAANSKVPNSQKAALHGKLSPRLGNQDSQFWQGNINDYMP